MQILDPGKIKDEKKLTEQQTQRRILALQHEEAEANRRTNSALERERIETARIAAKLGIGIPELEVQKQVLEGYVPALEARRAEALKPVEQLMQEAQAQIAQNVKETAALKERSKQLDSMHDQLLERIDAQSDIETELKEKLEQVEREKKSVTASQEEVKRSITELSQKWLAYHEEVIKTNTELAKKAAENDVVSKANADRAAELDKIAAEHSEHDRAIKDRYATLQMAVEEAQRKYGITI